MRTIVTALSISALFFASFQALATNDTKTSLKTVPKAAMAPPTSAKQVIPLIKLYAEPKAGARVLTQFNPQQRLIPIFRQKGWIKVGDPKDGKVGWLNRQEYREALTQWYKPNVQSYFVQTEQSADGKPTVKVIAYSNGKKLSDSDAQKLYQRMQKQSQREWQAMNRFNRSMEHLFARERAMMLDEGFGCPADFAIMPPFVQPIIVIHEPAGKNLDISPKK